MTVKILKRRKNQTEYVFHFSLYIKQSGSKNN